MSHKLNKYEVLYKQNQISSDSFERRKNSLERWKERNYQLLESKKNKYLMFYGNLNELMSIMKDKSKPSGQKSSTDRSLNDSDIKFSDNRSYSEFSGNHERRKSLNCVRTDFRNYVKDHNQYSFTHTEDQNKQRDRLNISKDSEKVNDRLHTLQILQNVESSKKGPVMVKDDSNLLPNDDTYEIGRKSEGVKLNPNLDNYVIQDDKKSNDNEVQEFLKPEILDDNNRVEVKDSDENQNESDSQIPKVDPKDSDELVAFPSDDENSKRIKDQVINDIDSEKSQSNTSKPDNNINIKDKIPKRSEILYENEDNKESISNKSQHEQDTKSIDYPETDNQGAKFPDISTEDKVQKDTIPNYDLINEVIDAESIEDVIKSNSDTNIENDLLNKDLNEDNKSEHVESTSLIPKIENEDILIGSLKSNIQPKTEEPKQSPKNDNDITGFTDEDHKINKSFKASVVPREDEVPEKPSKLDLDDVPKIEHVPESDDNKDSKF